MLAYVYRTHSDLLARLKYANFIDTVGAKILNPDPVPNTSVTNTLKEDSVLLQFSFVNEGDI